MIWSPICERNASFKTSRSPVSSVTSHSCPSWRAFASSLETRSSRPRRPSNRKNGSGGPPPARLTPWLSCFSTCVILQAKSIKHWQTNQVSSLSFKTLSQTEDVWSTKLLYTYWPIDRWFRQDTSMLPLEAFLNVTGAESMIPSLANDWEESTC